MASGKDSKPAINPTCCTNPLAEYIRNPREVLAYVTCINARWETSRKSDFIATIDLNPNSSTYSEIIHRLEVPNLGDELHHTGWNACSSCSDCSKRHTRLIVPGINSDRIYIVDVATNPRAPKLHKVIDSSELHENKAGAPHTVHCLPDGNVMISCLGDEHGNGKGTFILLEEDTFRVKGTWQEESDRTRLNYDFWYQPRHNIMVSSEWAAPNIFRKGFFMQDVQNHLYGRHLNFWDWTTKKLIQRIDLGNDGLIPLEVRFQHNPASDVGYVGCALSSTIHQFRKQGDSWTAQIVARVPSKKVTNWALPEMPGLITDIIISMDDRFLYISNWLHGDIRQYDISDSKNVKLVDKIFLGGSICKGGKVVVTEDSELQEQPERPKVKGVPVRGGPQMLQLSCDGRRLYVTNSLFSAWDEQFYPENIEKGSMMLLIDVDTQSGGLTLNPDFLVDFGSEGNVLAHEMRFPGGDSTSDIFM